MSPPRAYRDQPAKMSRPLTPTPLLEEALAAWLSGAPAAVTSAEDSDEGRLVTRALSGHSPSARSLANSSDLVVAMADLASEGVLPVESAAARPSLKDRILSSVASAPARVSAPPGLTDPPNEVLGRMHAHGEDPARLELLDRLGARGAAHGGGVGQSMTDRALAHLLQQLWPFLGFDVVFVSAVVGPETIHRVHTGFPAHLGDLDVVPRELSFCTHTLSAGAPFVVEDAAREPFFRRSILVQKLGARSYLGVPLFSKGRGRAEEERVPLGALCGISLSPRRISDADVALTACFASLAEALVAHDVEALEQMVGAPAEYPEGVGPASSQAPVVYRSALFERLVEAERVRDAGSRLLRTAEEEWQRLSALLVPNAVVTGEIAGAFRALLVPALARFEPDVEAALSALASERLEPPR